MTKEYSRYQKNVINNYYQNLETISLQKLAELVSELYLADTPAQQRRLWERVEKAMAKLKIPQRLTDHILEKRDVQILARNLETWQNAGK